MDLTVLCCVADANIGLVGLDMVLQIPRN
jgi:hypothetical protein